MSFPEPPPMRVWLMTFATDAGIVGTIVVDAQTFVAALQAIMAVPDLAPPGECSGAGLVDTDGTLADIPRLQLLSNAEMATYNLDVGFHGRVPPGLR